jgi:hypothetical protein
MSISKFERFFRETASLDVDKDDLKRYTDFINDKVYDLLLRGQANAKANLRDVIEPQDLPITKGLQESIESFRKIDQEIALSPVLDQLTNRPPLDMDCSVDTEAELPRIAGGLSIALAHTFKILDPKLKNPHAAEWERCEKVFKELI